MDMTTNPLKIRCPGCGSANYVSDPVCMSCGRELAPPTYSASGGPASPPADLPRQRAGPPNANLVLFLGLASVLLWLFWGYALLLGPVAWVLGNKTLAAAGEESPSERTRIQTGRICGMISTGFLGILLALLLSLGSLLTGVSAPTIANNTPAPDLTLPDLSGRPQTLSAYRGRIVLLNFFASWCGPCNAEAPHLERDVWQRRRAQGVVVISVDTGESGDASAAAARFQAEHQLTYPLLVDQRGAAQRAYGVHAFPTNVLIDRQGRVRYTGVGFDPAGIDRVMGELLRE